LSTKLLAAGAPADQITESRPLPLAVTAPPAGRGAAAALAWTGAGLAALLVHLLLPDGQAVLTAQSELPCWRRPYPLVLEASVLLSVLLAAAQWGWRGLRPWAHHYAPLLALVFGWLAVWDLATLKLDLMHLPFFPGPAAVLDAMIEDRGLLGRCAGHSLALLLTGYLAGVGVGVTVGVLIGWFPRVRYWGMPIMKVVGPVPATVLFALVMTMWSDAFMSAVTLIACASWFPVAMLTLSGVANVPLSYLDVARALGAGRLFLIFRVAIPAALPSIFLGSFMGLLASFLALGVAETVGVKAGLSWYLNWKRGYVEFAHVYASVVLMVVFFSTIMTGLFKVRNVVLSWQKGVLRW
jgi:NitT/TauT family transport system permease protein